MLNSPRVISGLSCRETISDPINAPGINACVAAIRSNNLYGATRDALDAIGGSGNGVHEGESVFIKPNMVSLPFSNRGGNFLNSECTKPEIILAVTEECLKAGASDIIIGDGSHLFTFDWTAATTLDGSTNLVNEIEVLNSRYQGTARVSCLEDDSPEWVEIPSSSHLDHIAISSLLTNVDRGISIAVAKTHSWAQLTLSTKNFLGITSLRRYAAWVNNSYWDRGHVLDHSSPEAIARIYLDIVQAIQPDLAVIDLSIGIEGDGPTIGSGGTTVDMQDRLGSWLIIASTDLMAIDATAARTMNHSTDQIAQLEMGYESGLGEIRPEAIEIVGDTLDNLIVEWRPAQLRN